MVFRSFRTQIILRVLFLATSLLTLIFLAIQTNLYATSVLLLVITAFQVWSLIRFVDRTNFSLSRFFDAIRYGDFLQTNSGGQFGSSFNELSRAMNQVSSAFQTARSEKEEQYHYLQTIIQHVGIGLLAFDETGRIELLNPAAKRLLQISQLVDLQSLRSRSAVLVDALERIGTGEKTLIEYPTDYETLHLSIHAAKIRLRNKPLTLVSLQNIGSELAEQEMAAWQNLIKVLTHEIMNSMTPIASLAESVGTAVRSRIEQRPSNDQADELSKDICDALSTIERRSEGLIRFVESYRDLTRIPQPDIRTVSVHELIARVDQLMESSLRESTIERTTDISPRDLTVACDADLIEQVIINLFSNAIWALRNAQGAKLEVTATINREGRVVIEVSDNGPGIVPAVQDKVFVPFFSTKKGGSGIGLALSRQIMRLHRGHITVRSVPCERTVFTLTF